jgi:SAM-dependent methyltransferase
VPDDRRVEWRTADALALPFGNGTFDAVVCQFGFMFFPDKAAAAREMKRVLKGGGQLLLSTWGSLADNPVAGLAFEVIASFYHTNPPRFLETPFGSYDPQPILAWLTAAGFSDVEYEVVDIEGHSASAELAAQGIVLGTPNINQISERGGVDPTVIVHAVAARLASEGGAVPMRLPMRALVFSARA